MNQAKAKQLQQDTGRFSAELKRTFELMSAIEAPSRAACAAYYGLLSTIPLASILIVVIISVIHWTQPGTSPARHLTPEMFNHALGSLLPSDASSTIQNEVERLYHRPPALLLSLGLVVSAWTASNSFLPLMKGMSTILEGEETRPWWQLHAVAILLTMLMSLILLVALFGLIMIPAIQPTLPADISAPSVAAGARWSILYLVIFFTYGLIYKLGTRPPQKHRMFSPGTTFASAVFLCATLIFELYVTQWRSYDRIYGSIAGVIVYLVWLWLSSACVLFGCAINKAVDEGLR